MKKVLVLGGGPDAEREVSLNSAAGVAEALRSSGRWEVIAKTIDRITLSELRALPGDVIFPVLHGAFGEGGPIPHVRLVRSREHPERHALDHHHDEPHQQGVGVGADPER
jgi:D-alanine-D-alanine ligase-like ATP-grasp enzyme